MLRGIAISLGLVGLTSLGGVALSKGHDMAFAPPVLATPLPASPTPDVTAFEVTRSVAPTPVAVVAQPPVQLASLETSVEVQQKPRVDLQQRAALAPATALRPTARPNAHTTTARPAAGGDERPTVRVTRRPIFSPTLPLRIETATRGATTQVATLGAPTMTRGFSAEAKPRFLIGVYR